MVNVNVRINIQIEDATLKTRTFHTYTVDLTPEQWQKVADEVQKGRNFSNSYNRVERFGDPKKLRGLH